MGGMGRRDENKITHFINIFLEMQVLRVVTLEPTWATYSS